MISPQYAAGFFDGEGCISIIYTKVRKWKRDPSKTIMGIKMVVMVANTNKSVLQELMNSYGGQICISNKGREEHHLPVHSWRLTNHKSKEIFLLSILPFCVVKKKQVEIGLRFLKTGKKPGERPTEEEWKERIRCYEEMIPINKRGIGQPRAIPPPLPTGGQNPKRRGYSQQELNDHMHRMRSSRGT